MTQNRSSHNKVILSERWKLFHLGISNRSSFSRLETRETTIWEPTSQTAQPMTNTAIPMRFKLPPDAPNREAKGSV